MPVLFLENAFRNSSLLIGVPSTVNRVCAVRPEEKIRMSSERRRTRFIGNRISFGFCMLQFQVYDFIKLLARKFFCDNALVFIQKVEGWGLVHVVQLAESGLTRFFRRLLVLLRFINVRPAA